MRTVANQSQRRLLRRVSGSTQLPSTPQCDAGRYSIQNATAKDTTAAALNQGLKGSRAVRVLIQAPLIPMNTSTSGTTQQTDAPMAAMLAPTLDGTEDFAGVACIQAYASPYPGTASSYASKHRSQKNSV